MTFASDNDFWKRQMTADTVIPVTSIKGKRYPGQWPCNGSRA
jgi:hypothetical protein